MGRTSSIGRDLAVLLLVTAGLAPPAARAQDATWLAAPGSNDFNTGANWSTGSEPTGVASFDASTTTSLVFSNPTTIVTGLTFNAGAPAYTFTTTGVQGLSIGTGGIVNNSGNAPTLLLGGNNGLLLQGTAGDANITLTGSGGSLQLSGTSSAGSGTITANAGTQVQFNASSTGGTARLVISNDGLFDMSPLATAGMTAGSIEGAGSFRLGSKQLTVGGNDLSTTVSGVIADGGGVGGTGGSLVKTGAGTLTLTGANTYTGGTTVSAGALQGNTTSLQGAILNDAAVVFDQAAAGTYAGTMSGTGSLTKLNAGTLTLTGTNSYSGGTTVSAGALQGNTTSLQGAIVNNASVIFDQAAAGTYAGSMSGTGSLTKLNTGTLILSGANTYAGPTTITGGRLAVNGSITSDVTVGAAGDLGGSGTITGTVVNNGMLSPGNSIGTLTVSGSYTQAAGSFYQVEVNAAGQSDRINVTGAPGTATINGGTVNVVAAPGSYGRSTTYTILNATGGVTGTYAGVTSNFAFLTPTLAYDANNVYLTLLLRGFTFSGLTPNQTAVGNTLDQVFAGATGDFAAVLDALSGLSSAEAPQALDQLGGEVYSGFALAGIQASRLFMNEVGRQMRSARGGTHAGSRMAVVPAFDGACSLACSDDAPVPWSGSWSAWAAALGSTGRVTGDTSNTHSATYTIGGFAAGVDYRVDRRLLVGLGAGYTGSAHYLGGLDGRGTTDAYQVALYASLDEGGFYLDGLAGYARHDNRMRRTIAFAGLAPRTASGGTHADQLFGQVETGYRLGLYSPADASLTPFARLQASTSSQAAFSESGAGSIDLSVVGQTTNSVRSIVGAELAGAIDAGWREKIALQLRLGWAHEHADVSHPVTASFAGAPANGFTVFGAVPSRDSAIVSLAADTAIGRATGLYLRYDGDISSSDSSHALSVGARMTW